ncbi:unnamed protein product, partial [Prorocentrum cordatum]
MTSTTSASSTTGTSSTTQTSISTISATSTTSLHSTTQTSSTTRTDSSTLTTTTSSISSSSTATISSSISSVTRSSTVTTPTSSMTSSSTVFSTSEASSLSSATSVSNTTSVSSTSETSISTTSATSTTSLHSMTQTSSTTWTEISTSSVSVSNFISQSSTTRTSSATRSTTSASSITSPTPSSTTSSSETSTASVSSTTGTSITAWSSTTESISTTVPSTSSATETSSTTVSSTTESSSSTLIRTGASGTTMATYTTASSDISTSKTTDTPIAVTDYEYIMTLRVLSVDYSELQANSRIHGAFVYAVTDAFLETFPDVSSSQVVVELSAGSVIVGITVADLTADAAESLHDQYVQQGFNITHQANTQTKLENIVGITAVLANGSTIDAIVVTVISQQIVFSTSTSSMTATSTGVTSTFQVGTAPAEPPLDVVSHERWSAASLGSASLGILGAVGAIAAVSASSVILVVQKSSKRGLDVGHKGARSWDGRGGADLVTRPTRRVPVPGVYVNAGARREEWVVKARGCDLKHLFLGQPPQRITLVRKDQDLSETLKITKAGACKSWGEEGSTQVRQIADNKIEVVDFVGELMPLRLERRPPACQLLKMVSPLIILFAVALVALHLKKYDTSSPIFIAVAACSIAILLAKAGVDMVRLVELLQDLFHGCVWKVFSITTSAVPVLMCLFDMLEQGGGWLSASTGAACLISLFLELADLETLATLGRLVFGLLFGATSGAFLYRAGDGVAFIPLLASGIMLCRGIQDHLKGE